MGPRPAHLNLGQDRREAFDPPKMPFNRTDLPSPRTGEVPPALSPLDAFAAQSRMLARQFDREGDNGRRISRLPPVVVASGMSNRPNYFRSLSTQSEDQMSDVPEVQEDSPLSARMRDFQEAEKNRPLSHYPVLDVTSRPLKEQRHIPQASPLHEVEESPARALREPQDYFGLGAPRASSPEPVDPAKAGNLGAPSPAVPSLTSSIDTVSSHPRTMTNESQRSQRSQPSDRGLAPPVSPRYPRSPRSFQSIRSVPPDSGDEDGFSVNSSHPIDSSRKFSGSSNMSRPQSPFSPWMNSAHNSPSMTSEYSMSASQLPLRPAANFSRPMSSSGSRPSFDARPSFESRPSCEIRPPADFQSRHVSAASQDTGPPSSAGSRQNSSDDVKTPYANANANAKSYSDQRTMAGHETYFDSSNITTPSATQASSNSYIYAKYALPRGRPMERTSAGGIRDSWIQRQFNWDKPEGAAPVPSEQETIETQIANLATFDTAARAPSPVDLGRPGRQLAAATSAIRSRSADPRSLEQSIGFPATTPTSPNLSSPKISTSSSHRAAPSLANTESTDRTVRATPLHQKSASADLTAEEHLEIGIQAHSAGETTKSTYHLRLAAIAGLPTAMLLYALACRHGWGMRANAEEGVKWLRKAVETAGLDVNDAEVKLSVASRERRNDPVAEAAERRERKAQYALAVYELGVSSLRGWGCPKDKGLALRCFEIAGSWGDVDALAEAGYCYAQGVGCKKDLKKAAGLYRRAEKGGMAMAGQSWIYKAKYMEDDAASLSSSRDAKKRPDTAVSRATTASTKTNDDPDRDRDRDRQAPQGRARSRSLWGRKKDKDRDGVPALPAS